MLSKILALILSLSLMVPVGSAAERIDRSTLPATENAAAPAPGATEKAPEPLTEEEAAALSARAEDPSQEVKGGALSNLHLTYAVIALAAIVLVLVLK